ncbi:dihydrodipicolinate synthase family protein [Salipiger abyssi]|uniref:dihydrodipicolinate synthase family protein n=1 Tax=Salipiger abyssi TaxID=1250539 RepID=UPI001A906489|nr:dihydrodipicolinate synthase family protein [Salipiger abyssi]MBN9888165.1 dihydrodipicolinate synthase family protein [Salipiger abyssi]
MALNADLRLPGSIVAPLTPFTEDLSVDFDALKGIIDYSVETCGAAMIIAAGVEAQEYQYLDYAARKELVDKTIEFVDGRRPVVVGVSHPSFRTAVDLAHHAADKGAQAVQLLAPNRPTGGPPKMSELVRYYQSVLAETDLPMMLYLNAGPGTDLSVPATVELAQLPGIDFVKESSRDLARVSRLIAEIETAGHARYFTTMQMYLPTLLLGGSGVTLPPPAALLIRKITEAWQRGDIDEASRIQRQTAVWPARWMPYGLAAVMKASLNHLGVKAGLPYPPYEPVTGEALTALHAYLDTTDLTAP